VKVKGSCDGVMSAAPAKIATIMPRRQERILVDGKTPTRCRNSTTTGNSKATPKASSVSVTNDR
jgi:hypothetical protein